MTMSTPTSQTRAANNDSGEPVSVHEGVVKIYSNGMTLALIHLKIVSVLNGAVRPS